MNFFKKLHLTFIAAFVLMSFSVSAQLEKSQASYIYNFTRFIEWPANNNSGEFIIGVLGKNHPITSELSASAAARKVGSLSVKVVEFAKVEDITFCHMLFVPVQKTSFLKKINDKFGTQGMLVLTEEQDWNPSESTINFMVVDSKLGFHINQKNASAKQLKLSEKLIALSK
jgi:hypothetical protein